MNTTQRIIVVLVLLNVVMAGCMPATAPAPAITPTPTMTPVSTPTPTTAPTPTAFIVQRAQVLDYIASLSNAPSFRGAISGQNAGHGDEITDDSYYRGYRTMIEALYKKTGKWPGIIGDDYEWSRSFTPTQLSAANQVLINYARSGGIVMITLTPLNPWFNDESDIAAKPGSWQGPESALSSPPAGASLDDLLNPDKPVHAAWMRKLDRIAGALQELRDAGVVVLFRPMQEMNANWYWWGISSHPSDPGPYIRVYRAMHDYFTKEKGLNNLLWVYSPSSTHGNNTRTSSMFRAVDWDYPGGDYVDVIAGTNYEDDMSIADYDIYVNMGKPLGIAEYEPENYGTGNWDTSLLIKRIQNDYPRIAFFLCWHGYSGKSGALVDNLNADILLKDPSVINRDSLPWNVH